MFKLGDLDDSSSDSIMKEDDDKDNNIDEYDALNINNRDTLNTPWIEKYRPESRPRRGRSACAGS